MLADSVTSGWMQCSSFGHRLESKRDRFEYYLVATVKSFLSVNQMKFSVPTGYCQQFSTTIKTPFLIAVS